ncbi:MAG TPA: MFS transporter [Jatrophihabitantaceae bacterium]|nr:MFS transporter [Jatrophihabitantaceae bacterium]
MAWKQHVLSTETSAASPRRFGPLLVVALALTGLSMRTAVTSVGAVLDDLQAGLHTSSGVSGVITTLPVICFALIGAAAPRLAHRFGAHQLLVASLAAMTVGLLGRAAVGQVWAFILLSVLALSGGAVANVLLPTLVKRHFPDRIGRMTAVYTTALAVGTTAAAGLTVPFGSLGSGSGGDGWRYGLGAWALFSAVAIIPWLPTLRHDRPVAGAPRGLAATRLMRSPTAWALTIFFAFQSFQAYIAFGWFAKFMDAHGVTSGTAGAMVAVLSAMTIPVSMVVPSVPASRHRTVLIWLTACYLAAYVGLAVAPVGGAWMWMVLTGIGSGQFPLALTMIGLRSRSSETTAALSAFVQSIGYIVAGSGPLLFGVLNDLTGGWALPLALLFIGLAIAVAAGLRAALPRFVDDEMARSAA